MLDHLKPLVVILALAFAAFAFAKPICLKFIEVDDFFRRKKVWLALVITAFLAPNLWIYAAVALPLVYWAAKLDSNPAALYLFVLLSVPPAQLPIPLPFVNQLFDLSTYRILAIAILIPTVGQLISKKRTSAYGMAKVDLIILLYGLLQLILYMKFESPTNTLRRGFLFLLDTFVLYFVFSRIAVTKKSILDVMTSFWVSCFVLVPITFFESIKGWLLFTGIPDQWGVPNAFAFLMREDSLRAQASSGHSLTMGYLFAIAFGFWVYLGGKTVSRKGLWGIGVFMWIGLYAAYSRAPWLVALSILVVYIIFSPIGRKHAAAVFGGLGVIFICGLFTPFGARIVATMPFIGTAEQFNVDYRQQLAEVSWQLIKQNPFFGNPFALNYMEDLRQGQGIIDFVNTYAAIAVFYGLVGVSLFVICFAYPLLRTAITMWTIRKSDVDGSNLGAILIACLLGTLLMMATASFGNAFEQLAWVLAGLCSAYGAAVYRVNEEFEAHYPLSSPNRQFSG